jgi:mono/diheme cytochrome c family protein
MISWTLKLFTCALALLILNSCAKRESKEIGAGKTGTDNTDQTSKEASAEHKQRDDNKKDPIFERSKDVETKDARTLPEGLSQYQYENGKQYVGTWNGLNDEADPRGRWFVSKANNPTSFNDRQNTGAAGSSVTLAEVKPIIQGTCVNCHSPTGERSSSPMVTDEQILQLYEGIKARVRNGSMPPGNPLPSVHVDLIARWTISNTSNPTQQNPVGGGGLQ